MQEPEPASNIRVVCAVHGSHPDPQWALKPSNFFIGKYVKLGFRTDDGRALEHMWVEVTGISGDFLVGNLNNDPVACSYLKDGTALEFTKDEIEGVFFEDRFLTHDD
jgi:Uncharacterized protein conserved in bacteria (DUF2314)